VPKITDFCSYIYIYVLGCKVSLVRLCDSDFGITFGDDITIGITCAAFCFHIAHISFANYYYYYYYYYRVVTDYFTDYICTIFWIATGSPQFQEVRIQIYYLTMVPYIINSMEQSPSLEANRFSSSQKFTAICRTRKLLVVFTTLPVLIPVKSVLPLHTSFFKIHFSTQQWWIHV